MHKIESTYVNRHTIISSTMQGICDANLKSLDVSTGVSGKLHDSRIFSLSFIKNKVMQAGPQYYLLGDAAYPISVNIMTPFRNYEHFTEEKREFNWRFFRTRVKIENAFLLLKQRWRQLIRTDIWHVVKIAKFIISYCVLHNLCIEHNDFLDEIEPIIPEPDLPQYFNNDIDRNRLLGEQKRNAFAEQFMNE